MLHYSLNLIIALTVFGCSTLLGFINLLFILRKRFPIKVNCWFCNTNLRVPYINWNSFTCPKCQQYNGFDEDGNYNKEIIEQHNPRLNASFYCQRTADERSLPSPSNGFCEFCSRNQELKVVQLANFRPRCESNYDKEIEEFRQKLEDSYQLCQQCQRHLNRTLNRVKTKFIGSKINQLNAKLSKELGNSVKIIVDDGKLLSNLMMSCILLLSIANFMRDMNMNIELPEISNEIVNIYNHVHAFIFTIWDIFMNWTKEMELNELFEDVNIDKLATSAITLNLFLILNDLKRIKTSVIFSILLWSIKMVINEIYIKPSYILAVNGTMAAILIISSLLMFKKSKKDDFNTSTNVFNSSFHKIPTEMYDESDTEFENSDTTSYFERRSTRTAMYSNSSRLNSSFRTCYQEAPKTLNSTFKRDVNPSHNNSFNITKEVMAADRTQVQNDITRLKIDDAASFSISSTIKEFNKSQVLNPFALERSRCDSPAPSVATMFSTSTKTNLISPPRLHSPQVYTNDATPSWVAGGYWGISPQKKYLNALKKPVISRSSSQSSGLGTIDDSEKNSRENSILPEETQSVFSDATSIRRSLFERPTTSRSLFSETPFLHQSKNHNFLMNNNCNNSFRKYRESNMLFK